MQFVLLAAVAVIGWFGYKSFVHQAEKVTERAKRERREKENRAVGTLVQDPETGEYRPVRDDD